MTDHLDAANVREGSRLLDIGCGYGGLIRTASARGISHATGLTLSEDQYDFVKDLALPVVNIHLTSDENFPAKCPCDAAISIGAFEHFVKPGMSAAERLRIYKKFFQQVAHWLKPGDRLSLQTICRADIDRVYADEFVPIDVWPKSDLPLLSKIFAASRMTFEPTVMTASADDYVRTLKEWPRRLRANRVQIKAGPREPKLVKAFEDYFRTSILGFRNRWIGLARMALSWLDRVGTA